MTDSATRQRLARDFVAGLESGDLDRMRSALHPEVTWSVPGETSISGVADGADAVLKRAQAITSSDVVIELQYLLDGWENAAVALHNTGARGSTRLDEVVIIVFTFADDKIRSAENLISDVPGLNAYFAAAG